MKNKNKHAYRFIEKALKEGPSLEAAPNAQHPEDAVRAVLLYAAMTQRTIESAVTVLKDRGRDTPSPDMVLNRLRNTNTGDLVTLFEPCLEKVFREAKRRRLLAGRKRVAVDIHEKPFYGEAPGTVRGQAKLGTTRFWAYITLDIVQNGCRYTLAALPLTDKRMAAELVETLLRYSLRWIRMDMVLLDRFFYRSDVIGAVEGLGLDWLMVARTSGRMRGMAEQALEEGHPCFVYTMNEGKESQATFHVSTVPAEKGGGCHFFATSREVRGLRYWAGVYGGRWGIETGYRVKKGFRVRTAVRDLHMRLFLFLLSVLLQDVWELLGRGDGVTADLFRDRCVRLILDGLLMGARGSPPGMLG